jgi:hypothetical protein
MTERLSNYSKTLGPGSMGPARCGSCPLTALDRFDLIYLQQPFDIAGHDQAEIFDLEL